jgi:hypothetical protein
MNKLTTDWIDETYKTFYSNKFIVGSNIKIARVYVFGGRRYFYVRGEIGIDFMTGYPFYSIDIAKKYADEILIKCGYSVIPEKLKLLI